MARTGSTQHHHLQEPETGLYYARRPDGTTTLSVKPSAQTAFHTSALAIEYATQTLPGQACEIVRVAA